MHLLAGRQLLQSLEKGSVVRKKWVTHMPAEEIASAAKTTRTVRCVVKDSKMCLQYAHQVCCHLKVSASLLLPERDKRPCNCSLTICKSCVY